MEVGEIINIIIGTNMKEGFIIHFRTMEIEEILKVVMKTSIGMKISMTVINPMICTVLTVEIGHITETGHIVETGTAPENTKETIVEIGCIAEIDHIITMKEISPVAGIDCKNAMARINHAEWTDHQSITKIIMKEGIIIHFRTMKIGENIKIIIKTNIGIKISMIVTDLMIWMILMVGIGHIVETDHVVEIDHETTVEMSIRWKVINIRESLKIIMKPSMKTGTVWINMNASSEMTIMT